MCPETAAGIYWVSPFFTANRGKEVPNMNVVVVKAPKALRGLLSKLFGLR